MTVGMSQQLQLNVMHAPLQQTRQCDLTAAGTSKSIQQLLKKPLLHPDWATGQVGQDRSQGP